MSTTRPGRGTREAILDAAVRMFSERAARPSEEVRVEDIARGAGVSRRSVYVHFGSRAGLLVAMVQHFDAGGTLTGLIQRVFAARTSLEALNAVVRLHAEYSPVAYPIAKVLMVGRHGDDAIRAAWHDRMDARRALYATVVRRLKVDRLLRAELDVRTATDIVWALTSWQVWEQLVIDLRWSKARYRRHLALVLREALVQRPDRP